MSKRQLILRWAVLGSLAVGVRAAAEPPADVRALPASLPAAQLAAPLALPAAIASGGAVAPKAAPAPKPALTMADLKAQIAQKSDGTFLMEVPKILNTATDREAQVLLEGQSVETTGQVMPEPLANIEGKRLRITRSEILCCSSHARQCSVSFEFAGLAPALKEMSWVTVVGRLTYRREGIKSVPVIVVKEIREIEAPATPLLQ